MPITTTNVLAVLAILARPLFADVATHKPMFNHVAMFSIDGLHNSDIDKYLSIRPHSNIAKLLNTGYRYTNCNTSAPSDSFPGTIAQLTGGDPATTGIWYDDTWDFTYYPPASSGSNCTGPAGAEVLYDESIDYDSTKVFSGGINPANLPQTLINGVCTPVYPHKRIRVNTIFEVVRSENVETAYADKHPAYDIARGPSGQGLTVGYFPEQAASVFPDNIGLPSINATIAWDDYHKRAFLAWLDGKNVAHQEGKLTKVPTLMGGNFQSVSVAQKQIGYLNTTGNPQSEPLIYALDSIDDFLGKFVAKLKKNNLYSETLIIVASKHGQAPINPTQYATVDPQLVTNATGVPVAFQTSDDIALIYLTNASTTALATTNLFRHATTLRISRIFSGANLTAAGYGDPATDPRVPHIIVEPQVGTIYTTSRKKIAEHGGLSDDDRHVACFVSNPELKGRVFEQGVVTKMVAPTVLRVLGFERGVLRAVQMEGTGVLPGF